MSDAEFEEIAQRLQGIQDRICGLLEEKCGERFHEDAWTYERGNGGGRTRVWENDRADSRLEKAGVNFSRIEGTDLPTSAAGQLQVPVGARYRVAGVSLVIHPRSPFVPTIHMNVRYFECPDVGLWWVGGGIDLTPYYPVRSECARFHSALRDVCTAHGQSYAAYKKECDEYFALPHRGEMRGVGGIFFDRLSANAGDAVGRARVLDFLFAVGAAFNGVYAPFLTPDRLARVPTDAEREFQLLRRGRYVEFNLIYDRGTKFGLQSGGRTESILMSLPCHATWRYNWRPAEGSREEAISRFYFQPQNWVALADATDDEDFVQN